LHAHLAEHVAGAVAAGACMPPSPVPSSESAERASVPAPVPVDDAIVRLAAEHSADWVQITLARGLGVARLRAVADTAAQARLWLRAGQAYFLAGAASEGGHGVGSTRDAFAALRSVEPLS
jgi:hypothetical protein